MKYKFQDTSLVVGQLKEILKDFNLPMVPIYTDNTIPYDGRVYIKDNQVVRYRKNNDKEWFDWLSEYTYNREVINLTKKFTIKSSSYDRYTHRYLGEYLRFLRDKDNMNLMSMYNCFDYDQPKRIYNYTKFSEKEGDGYLIDTDNKNYNYYILPVKFNQIYTIAIDSQCDYDILCCLYNNKFTSDTPVELIKQSLTTTRGSKFSKSYLYSTYFSCAGDCWQKEKDLRMILKLPKRITSTITILEGDYTESSNTIDGRLITEYISSDKYISKNSLLEYNNKNSYPFADRLVEYLLGNVIGPRDEIGENIKRIQNELYPVIPQGYPGIWSDEMRKDIYDHYHETDKTRGKNPRIGNTIRKIDIDTKKTSSTKYEKRFIDLYNDVIGYVDIDTENMIYNLWWTNIKFDHQGGKYYNYLAPINNMRVKYKSELPEINVPTKSGYRLEGYFEKENGKGTMYFDKYGSPLRRWDKVDKECTLYACWVKE